MLLSDELFQGWVLPQDGLSQFHQHQAADETVVEGMGLLVSACLNRWANCGAMNSFACIKRQQSVAHCLYAAALARKGRLLWLSLACLADLACRQQPLASRSF